MISIALLSGIFFVKMFFVEVIGKKTSAISYGAVMLFSLFGRFVPGYALLGVDEGKAFLVSVFAGIFFVRLFDDREDEGNDWKMFILFILLALSHVSFVLISLFFYVNGTDYGRMFIVLFLALLKSSLVVDDDIIYAALFALLFSGFKEESIEDSSIKAYTGVFLLGMIDNEAILEIAIVVGIAKGLLLLIRLFGQEDVASFMRRLLCFCVMIFFLCEISTRSGMLGHIILSLVLLSVLLESVVKRYIFVFSKNPQKAVGIRPILGNKNFTLFFVYLISFAPLNPVFNGFVYYLSFITDSQASFYGILSFSFIFMLIVGSKLTFFAEKVDTSKNSLPDWSQFLLLGAPLGIAILFIPKGSSVELFFLLSFLYLLSLVLVTYFKEEIRHYVLKEDSRIIVMIEVFFDDLGRAWAWAFNHIIEAQHVCQKFLYENISGTVDSFSKWFPAIENVESQDRNTLDASIGLSSVFLFLLLLVVYYEYNL